MLSLVLRLLGRRRRRRVVSPVVVDVVLRVRVFVLFGVRVQQNLARIGRSSVWRPSVSLALHLAWLCVEMLGHLRLPLLAHRQ